MNFSGGRKEDPPASNCGWRIYDGFNGPDAPEFLMSNLYKAMYKKLEGLFWDSEETSRQEEVGAGLENDVIPENSDILNTKSSLEPTGEMHGGGGGCCCRSSAATRGPTSSSIPLVVEVAVAGAIQPLRRRNS
nr:protein phosphatase 2C 29 [Ipomoea batatas]